MKKSILSKLAKKEARELKKKATREELDQLDFRSLGPASASRCIYGQMTGDCFSDRASRLIHQCAERVYDVREKGMAHAALNGKPKEDRQMFRYYSPIEIFIHNMQNRENGNNEILVDYLKGKTKTLKFKKF